MCKICTYCYILGAKKMKNYALKSIKCIHTYIKFLKTAYFKGIYKDLYIHTTYMQHTYNIHKTYINPTQSLHAFVQNWLESDSLSRVKS